MIVYTKNLQSLSYYIDKVCVLSSCVVGLELHFVFHFPFSQPVSDSSAGEFTPDDKDVDNCWAGTCRASKFDLTLSLDPMRGVLDI